MLFEKVFILRAEQKQTNFFMNALDPKVKEAADKIASFIADQKTENIFLFTKPFVMNWAFLKQVEKMLWIIFSI